MPVVRPIDLPPEFFVGDYVRRRRLKLGLWYAAGGVIGGVGCIVLLLTLQMWVRSGARDEFVLLFVGISGAIVLVGAGLALFGHLLDMRFLERCIKERPCPRCAYPYPPEGSGPCSECEHPCPYS